MKRYILKRILVIIPVILGISIVIFTLMSLSPGDTASQLLGRTAKPEEIERMKESLGLNDPLPTQYFRYMKNLVKGDFGTSFQSGKKVIDEIAVRFPVTLRLAFFSTMLVIFFGVGTGIISAVKQYSVLDVSVTTLALILASMPEFWVGLLLLLVFALQLRWLPAYGISSWTGYILPVFVLSLGIMAMVVRVTRSTMLEVIRQDYIRTARAKGADEKRVILKHALKNALIPIITVIGVDFGNILAGTVVIETVFSVPGMGAMIVNAVKVKDIPVAMTSTLFLSIIFSFIILLLDLAYARIDPRIKAEFSSFIPRRVRKALPAKENNL